MGDELKYESVERRNRTELLAAFNIDDPGVIAEALYSATYHDPDWKWVQEWCLTFLKSRHIQVRLAAATCLGNLAVFHRHLDMELALPALYEAADDPAIKSAVEDSLADIKQCVQLQ